MALKSIKNIYDDEGGSKGPFTGNTDLFFHSVQESGVWKSAAVTYDNLYADIYSKVKEDLEAEGWGPNTGGSSMFVDLTTKLEMSLSPDMTFTLPFDAALPLSASDCPNAGFYIDDCTYTEWQQFAFRTYPGSNADDAVFYARAGSRIKNNSSFSRTLTLYQVPNGDFAQMEGYDFTIPMSTLCVDNNVTAVGAITASNDSSKKISDVAELTFITAQQDSKFYKIRAKEGYMVSSPKQTYSYSSLIGGTATRRYNIQFSSIRSTGGTAPEYQKIISSTTAKKIYDYNGATKLKMGAYDVTDMIS